MKKEKKPLNVGIWAFLNKIPAGTMFVPLVISAIICTITVECGLGTGVVGQGQTLWEFLGNPMKDLFGKTGQMLLIGLMLFCTGTMIKPHDFVDVFKRGFWLLLARLFPAYLLSAIVWFTCGPKGFCGIDFITFTTVVTSANAALYMGIIPPYADNSDRAAFPVMLILSMPLLPFIFISSFGSVGDASGQTLTKIVQIFSLLIPFILGFILGNLDSKIREIFKGGNAIILPFLGFEFGSTINLVNAFKPSVLLAALLLTVIFWAITMIIPYIVDRYCLKRPGYASIGSSSLAGVSLSIPIMFSNYMFKGSIGADLISNSVSIMAFILLITNILSPFFTKGIMTYYFKHHQGDKISDVNRVFGETHPELISNLYDENNKYKK
jgi:2-keto-3-deoxygluconate permease